jgi:hypothetical protein
MIDKKIVARLKADDIGLFVEYCKEYIEMIDKLRKVRNKLNINIKELETKSFSLTKAMIYT